jgi:hypothetical protein
MHGRHIAVAAAMAVVLVACGVGAEAPTATRANPSPIMPSAVPATTPPSATAVATAPTEIPVAPPTLTPIPSSTPTPTTVLIPPKPAGVAFTVEEKALGARGIQLTATVSWRSPRTSGVTIKVYNVTECLSMPTPYMPENAVGPCLVEHTQLPPSALELAATATASVGTASWTWIDDSDCGWAGAESEIVVLAAYSTAGHSIFTIAAPGRWTSMENIC